MNKIFTPNGYQTNLRKDVIKFIKKGNIKPKKILEIGGGSGFTSEKLCQIYNCSAINVDLKIPEFKSKIVNHIEIDLNKNDLSNVLKNNKFDLVLALDVIEHIVDTEKLIEIIYKISKENCYVLISLPNIKNLRIPYNIYFRNTFPRKESGIFDKTHLRWFTKNDVIELIVKKKFKYINSCYTDHRSFFINNKLIEKVFGFLIAPQFIVCGQK